MTARASQSFPGRTAALRDVFDFVGRWGAGAGLGERDLARLHLVVEELFLNCVIHGYGSDSAQPVGITLRSVEGLTELLVEDCARAFDPFAAIEPPSSAADARERPVGRLGLPLVAQLSVRRSYERVDACNRTCVVLPRRA